MMRAIAFAFLFAAVAAAGCTDLSTPAELTHEQILAVLADPPVVAAGQRAALDVLVAGPDGIVEPATVRWSEPVLLEDGRAWFVAPNEVGADGEFATVEVTVSLDDGRELGAIKTIGIDVDGPATNPEVLSIDVGGQPAPTGEPMPLTTGASLPLELDAAPVPSADSIISWYVNRGEIEQYRRAPTELVAPDDPGDATLIVVYRHGLGVTWRQASLRFE